MPSFEQEREGHGFLCAIRRLDLFAPGTLEAEFDILLSIFEGAACCPIALILLWSD